MQWAAASMLGIGHLTKILDDGCINEKTTQCNLPTASSVMMSLSWCRTSGSDDTVDRKTWVPDAACIDIKIEDQGAMRQHDPGWYAIDARTSAWRGHGCCVCLVVWLANF